MAAGIPPTSFALGSLTHRVNARLKSWNDQRFGPRMWAKDHRLWSSVEIPELTNRLGWLWLPGDTGEIAGLEVFARQVRTGIDRVVLLGMGGSSLAPEVYQATFSNADGYPELVVLDSTHPASVRAVREATELDRALFVIASKSGGTVETLSLFRYFWGQVAERSEEPGDSFVALTDPGSSLETLARERGFRRIFSTPSEVGGRYSALTAFGLLPAALIGVDIRRLLGRAAVMADACGVDVPASRNPALRLGAAIGEAALAGRDKLTYVCDPPVSAFGAWVEQLVAESTGKDGTGIVPVAGEPLGNPGIYGEDRLFVHLAVRQGDSTDQQDTLEKLRSADHPVVRVALDDPYDLGAELFRSEMAVAAAGSVLGINPFDQPDVQIAKDLARRAMSAEGPGGAIDEVFADDYAGLRHRLSRWYEMRRRGDYIGIHAYLPMGEPAGPVLERLAVRLREGSRAAVTLGYGPRFLHSTGQLHKGGPDHGLFLQIVDRPAPDTAIPEAGFTFGRLIEGQAAGDFQALSERGRRVLRIRLGDDGVRGLRRVENVLSRLAGSGKD